MNNAVINFKELEEYLTSSISPKELAHQFDELEHDYAMLVISSEGIPCKSQADKLHTLRELRDLLIRIQGCDEL